MGARAASDTVDPAWRRRRLQAAGRARGRLHQARGRTSRRHRRGATRLPVRQRRGGRGAVGRGRLPDSQSEPASDRRRGRSVLHARRPPQLILGQPRVGVRTPRADQGPGAADLVLLRGEPLGGLSGSRGAATLVGHETSLLRQPQSLGTLSQTDTLTATVVRSRRSRGFTDRIQQGAQAGDGGGAAPQERAARVHRDDPRLRAGPALPAHLRLPAVRDPLQLDGGYDPRRRLHPRQPVPLRPDLVRLGKEAAAGP